MEKYRVTLTADERTALEKLVAQFRAVCRRSKMVAMGTRSARRGSRLYRRWALKWREEGQLLGQYLRATKRDKLSDMNEHKAIAIKRSRIDDLLIAEGLRWRTQETWFGERVDPEFAKKRGALRHSIRTRLQVVS